MATINRRHPAIEDMSVMELVELISAIEEKFGVTVLRSGSFLQQQIHPVKQQLKIKMSLMLCYQQQVIKSSSHQSSAVNYWSWF